VLYLSQLDVLLVSSWNAHVDLLMCAAVLVIAAAVSSGSVRLLPLLGVTATFVVQSHVATLPLAAAAMLLGIVPNLFDSARRHAARIPIVWTAGALVVLWLPPAAEQFMADDARSGNMAKMWAFIINPALERPTFGEAYEVWARLLTAVWRRALTLPGLQHAEEMTTWPLIAAPLQVALLAVVTAWASTNGRALHAWLAAHTGVASVAGLAALAQKPGEILDHEAFWITIAGLTGAAVIAGFMGAAVGERLGALRRLSRPLAAAAGATLMAYGAVRGIGQMQDLVNRSRVVDRYDRTVRSGATAVETGLVRLGVSRAVIAVDQRVWDWAAGMILQLRKRGVPVTMDESVAWMYPGAGRPDGGEDGEVYFCGGVCHADQAARPGNVVLFEEPGVIVVDGRRRGM
jgi:hypothetical protein